jgi:predicted nucleotidyltransferase
MLDKATVIDTVQRYADAVMKEFSPAAVVLFGSYAKDAAREESDIDVGIVFDGFHGDWLETNLRLWNLAYDISWDLEPHLLDTTQDKSGFVKHVLSTGQVVYHA